MNHAHSTRQKSKTKPYGHSLVPFENVRFKDLMAVCIKIMCVCVEGLSKLLKTSVTITGVPENISLSSS